MWNLFMSHNEVSRWLWLPGLLTKTDKNTPNIFLRGKFSDFGKFVDSVKRKLLVSRAITEENTKELDVSLHVY